MYAYEYDTDATPHRMTQQLTFPGRGLRVDRQGDGLGADDVSGLDGLVPLFSAGWVATLPCAHTHTHTHIPHHTHTHNTTHSDQ